MYDDILDYVWELHNLESRIGESQSRVSDPHLAVPESVAQDLEDNPQKYSGPGKIIPIGQDDQMPEFIVPDRDWEGQETTIDRILDRCWWLTGISPALLNRSANRQTNLHVPSGSALRQLARETIRQIEIFREVLDPVIKDVLIASRDAYGVEREMVLFPEKYAIKIDWGIPLVTEEELMEMQEARMRGGAGNANQD